MALTDIETIECDDLTDILDGEQLAEDMAEAGHDTWRVTLVTEDCDEIKIRIGRRLSRGWQTMGTVKLCCEGGQVLVYRDTQRASAAIRDAFLEALAVQGYTFA